MSNSTFVVEGVVTENLPNTMFRIKITTSAAQPQLVDTLILCTIAGRMRLHYVKLLPGDKVRAELNTLDLSRGRIVQKVR